jgi:hypothetical protein
LCPQYCFSMWCISVFRVYSIGCWQIYTMGGIKQSYKGVCLFKQVSGFGAL